MPYKLAEETGWDLKKRDNSQSQNMTSQFLHFYGFDREAKYQMLAAGVQWRIYAQGSGTDNFDFELDSTGESICRKLTVGIDTADDFPDASRRSCIYLETVKPGTGKLFLKNYKTRAVIDQIDLEVVARRDVSVRFYNVRDKSTHEGCPTYIEHKYPSMFSRQGMQGIVDTVNNIVGAQSNVYLTLNGDMRLLSTFATLGEKVRPESAPPKLFGQDGFDGSAKYHVCWVWGIEGDDPAATTNNFTFLNAPNLVGKDEMLAVTLAHELTHFLCGTASRGGAAHDKNQTDLMFPTYPHGIMLRKDRLKALIR